jgi:predicted peptidase
MTFQVRRLNSATDLPYALLEPPLGAAAGEQRPLIVFLHGSGERGNSVRTLDRLFVHSLPFLAVRDELPEIVAGAAFPFIIVCPQIASGGWGGSATHVLALVEELCAGGADSRRCYLTGISLGGLGCWQVADAAPDRFAALVPMSGSVRITERTASRPPAWVFHGEQDVKVSFDRARDALAAHPERPGTTTTFEPGGHSGEIWNRWYGDAALYEWMLEQRTASILR